MGSIKGGSIIHTGNGQSLIDRIQTGGPGQLNIPTEKIYELGNHKTVATIRDTPDLTFSLESFDTSTEVEALVTRSYVGRATADAVTTAADTTLTSADGDFTAADVGRMVIVPGAGVDGGELVTTIDTVTNGTTVEMVDPAATTGAGLSLQVVPNGIDLAKVQALDFAGQFKAGLLAADPFLVTASVSVPFLTLEQMSYRFGLRDNASQQGQFRGDSIYYNAGAAYVEETAGSGAPGQAVVTAYPAYAMAETDVRRVQAVTVGNTRLTPGADYVETYGAPSGGAAVTTVTLVAAVPADQVIRIVYSSPNALTYPQSVHPDTVLKPAAVRGRDIEIYVGGYDPNDRAGSQANKLPSVQAMTWDWRATLDKDEEFGNHYAVAQDFDVPTTGGSTDIKPRDPQAFLTLLRKTAGIADATKSIGPTSSVPLELDVVIKHPDTGVTVKRIHTPDARFTIPGYSGRVNQKLTVTLPWESDSGTTLVYAR